PVNNFCLCRKTEEFFARRSESLPFSVRRQRANSSVGGDLPREASRPLREIRGTHSRRRSFVRVRRKTAPPARRIHSGRGRPRQCRARPGGIWGERSDVPLSSSRYFRRVPAALPAG